MKSHKLFNGIAISVAIFAVFIAFLRYNFNSVTYGIEAEIKYAFEVWVYFVVVLNIFALPIYISNFISGINRKVSKKFEDTETFIYTRDVPEYNAAIAGMLYDFKADYEQEFIACVLDLIAQGYLIEENRLILDEEKVMRTRLENKFLKSENYILDLCEANVSRLKEGVMVDFEEALKEDLDQFGFFKKENIIDKIKKYFLTKSNQNEKKFLNLVDFVGILISFIVVIGIMKCFEVTIFLLVILCAILMIILRKTRLTKIGESEKEKITKLKHFLEKETSFDEKENSEKKIWDRYPAFAVALDVNKQISKDIMKKLNIKD